jgi:hypothetical protein
MVEPPKMSPAEVAALAAEAAAWVRRERERYRTSATPLNEAQQTAMRPFFPADILDRVLVVDLSARGERLPYPPFYSRVRAGGTRVVPDAAHLSAIPFIDLIAFGQKPTDRVLFHSLVQVTQFALLGVEQFMEFYARALNETGLYILVPMVEQAYQLDARYTRDPSDVYSVAEEIRQWEKSGRYGR